MLYIARQIHRLTVWQYHRRLRREREHREWLATVTPGRQRVAGVIIATIMTLWLAVALHMALPTGP
jgi:hypothetical protein